MSTPHGLTHHFSPEYFRVRLLTILIVNPSVKAEEYERGENPYDVDERDEHEQTEEASLGRRDLASMESDLREPTVALFSKETGQWRTENRVQNFGVSKNIGHSIP